MNELKRLLKSSKARKFIAHKPVNSRTGKTVNCWVFNRPDNSVDQAQHDRMTDFMTNMHPPQLAPPGRLTLDEHTVLTFLADGARAMTWPITNACGLIAGAGAFRKRATCSAAWSAGA